MTLFHVTTRDRAQAIARDGLDPSKGLDTPGQVWFYTDRAQALAHAGGNPVFVTSLELLLALGIVPSFRTAWDERACYVREHVPAAILGEVS